MEEITIGQAAVLAALGEKGSEKRAHTNSLCADGLIDLEQGLGYLLCNRFAGTMPTPLEGCPWDEDSARDVIHWTVMVHFTSHSIPAAVASAQRTRFDLERAAADRLAKGSGGVVV